MNTDTKTKKLFQITQALDADCDIIVRGFKTVGENATAAISQFAQALSKCAECEYLRYHKKLPGSQRTARLRKKRRHRILTWFKHRLSST